MIVGSEGHVPSHCCVVQLEGVSNWRVVTPTHFYSVWSDRRVLIYPFFWSGGHVPARMLIMLDRGTRSVLMVAFVV